MLTVTTRLHSALLRASLCMVLALGLTACGAEPNEAATVSVHAVPPAGAYISRKPSPQLGTLSASVLERPSADRVVIEASWSLRSGAEGCEVHLILPEAATLLEGDVVTSLADARDGRRRYLVAFTGDAPLDAVVRLCGTEAESFRSREVSVRITRD